MKQRAEIERFRRENLSSMGIREIESRSWKLWNSHSGEYWHIVTFTPGALFLSGDLGELVLVHYHAMRTWRDAAKWVANNGDVEYLLSKSPNAQRDYDPAATCAVLIEHADDDLRGFYRSEPKQNWGDLSGTVWADLAVTLGCRRRPLSTLRKRVKVALRQHLEERGPEGASSLASEVAVAGFQPVTIPSTMTLMQIAALKEWAMKVGEAETIILRGRISKTDSS